MRADKLQKEYQDKACAADRRQGVSVGTVGRVEAKLVSLGKVEGIVAGSFGEVSDATHRLVDALATNRVRVAGPTTGRQGKLRSEEAERTMAVSWLSAVRPAFFWASLTLGPGGTAALGCRKQSGYLEWRWRQETQANQLATRQGWRIQRGGFAKI